MHPPPLDPPFVFNTGREPPASRAFCNRFLDVDTSRNFWVWQMRYTPPSFMLACRPCISPVCTCHDSSETTGPFLSFLVSYGSFFSRRCALPPVRGVTHGSVEQRFLPFDQLAFIRRGDACARDLPLRAWVNPWQSDDPLLTRRGLDSCIVLMPFSFITVFSPPLLASFLILSPLFIVSVYS